MQEKAEPPSGKVNLAKPYPAKKNKRSNIVIIVADALRPDHLGCYGYRLNTSPCIDQLAKEGVLFKNFFSCACVTDSAFTTIFSGLFPVSHGIRSHARKVSEQQISQFERRKITLLPEILKKNGYSTIGIDWLGRWHKTGFDYYMGMKHSNRPSATNLVNEAIRAIRQRDEGPFFLFVHFWDTHTPYRPPEHLIGRFEPEKMDTSLESLYKTLNDSIWGRKLPEQLGTDVDSVEEVIAKYDASICYLDQEIARLVKALKDEGLFEETIIIFTADHGESLTEHGIYFSHHGLYDAVFRVPFIAINTQLNPDIIEEGFYQHTDLVPTVLDLLQIPYEAEKYDGASLMSAMNRTAPSSRYFIVIDEVYAEHKTGIRTMQWKYIKSASNKSAKCRICGTVHGGIEELYDLENDPGETKNLIEKFQKRALELRTRMEAWQKDQDKTMRLRYRESIWHIVKDRLANKI